MQAQPIWDYKRENVLPAHHVSVHFVIFQIEELQSKLEAAEKSSLKHFDAEREKDKEITKLVRLY